MDNTTNENRWAANRFSINESDVVWYNNGTCYDRIVVRTKSAALKVAKAVKGRTVNGGWFDGMALGHITKTTNGYDVTC